MAQSVEPSRGFGKRLSKLARRGVMIGWILVCGGCWVLAVRSFWRADVIRIGPKSSARYVNIQKFVQISSDEGSICLHKGSFVYVNRNLTAEDKVRRSHVWMYFSDYASNHDFSHLDASWSEQSSVTEFLTKLPQWLTPLCASSLTDSESRETDPWFGYAVEFQVPWWMILAMVHLPVPSILRSRRKRHRRENGLCTKCGYDLRGSSERCPECGTVI